MLKNLNTFVILNKRGNEVEVNINRKKLPGIISSKTRAISGCGRDTTLARHCGEVKTVSPTSAINTLASHMYI